MSTRARIALALANGKFRSIYLHKDGYSEGVGRVLDQHYSSTKLVKSLLALGDLSRLSPELAPAIGQNHDFGNPSPGVTVAYGRDRGDKETAAITSVNLTALAAAAAECNAEFLYVFDDDEWSFTPVSSASGTALPIDTKMTVIHPPPHRYHFQHGGNA